MSLNNPYKKILVLGSRGMVGSSVVRILSNLKNLMLLPLIEKLQIYFHLKRPKNYLMIRSLIIL